MTKDDINNYECAEDFIEQEKASSPSTAARLLGGLGFKVRGPGFWKPMLAHVYSPERPLLQYPLCSQPKLDGVRCLWDGERVWSRSGKDTIKPWPLVLNQLRVDFKGIPLDGELYLHSIPFEERVSRARTGGELEYWVFDMPMSEPFLDRFEHLRQMFQTLSLKNVRLLDTIMVSSSQEIQEELSRLLARGFEGQMLRNSHVPYVEGRTHTLLKMKPSIRLWGVVTGTEFGKGKNQNRIGSLCVTGVNGQWSCNVNLRSDISRESLSWVGKRVLVEAQELTRYGIPRFPRLVEVADANVL